MGFSLDKLEFGRLHFVSKSSVYPSLLERGRLPRGRQHRRPAQHEHSLMLCYSVKRRYVTLSRTTRLWVSFHAALCIALAANSSIAVDSARNTKEQLGLSCILALAPSAHSATIQANRGEQRVENARQRTLPAALFILPSYISPYGGSGSLVAEVAWRAFSLYAAGAQSGRSPPASLLGR
jgi:hypothetical protein